MSFALGEVRRLKSERISFTPLPPNFTDVLEQRCQALLDAQAAYTDAMRGYDAHWSAMAGYRVGQLYQRLHAEVMQIPPTAQAKTRAEVKAELAAAQRDGNVIADNESGRTAREINPTAYAAAPKGQALTREEVRAELRAAQESGNVIADNESGRTLREVYPNRYPKDVVAQGKTREQVKAELAEAQRTGDIIADGESGKKLNELYPSRYPKAN